MLDGPRLEEVIARHKPDHVVPEVEAIRTEVLAKLEGEGVHIVPSAKAAQLTMNRDGIRDLAARELGVRTSTYDYAENFEQVQAAADKTGFPCVIKPVMSSSGKGQSTVQDAAELETAWRYAVDNMRGDRARVIVEQFVDFEYEITLLTVAHKGGVLPADRPPAGAWRLSRKLAAGRDERRRDRRSAGDGEDRGRGARRIRYLRSGIFRRAQ